MPDPNDYDNEDDWMAACVPVRKEEGDDQEAAVAACLNIWRERNKSMKKNIKEISFEEVRQEIWEKLEPERSQPEYAYVEDIVLDANGNHAIIDTEEGYYFASFSVSDDGSVNLSPKEAWAPVERVVTWQPRKSVKAFIKSKTKDKVVVGGYAVIWGSENDRDLEGEYFTKDTDFWLDKLVPGNPNRVVIYEHGQHPVVKRTVLGNTLKMSPDDIGLSIEAELDRHKEYVELVLELAEAGILGWSSQAVGSLVDRENGQIKSWPIAEMTLTVAPAEPRLLGVSELRALSELGVSLSIPEGPGKVTELTRNTDEGKRDSPAIFFLKLAQILYGGKSDG